MIFSVNTHGLFLWKTKKDIAIASAFQFFLHESNRSKAKSKGCKPNKIWVDKGRKFYNRSMKSCLEKNGIEMYSPHYEGKSVIAGRFIRALKNKTYKHMISISKMCILIN